MSGEVLLMLRGDKIENADRIFILLIGRKV